jgi:4-cresol dehydrogenase (hydroxylating)
MNRILTVDEEFGYAIIEPGVTQASLAAYLHTYHPGLTINFTGSFAHTSIVGNVLERGDGRYARVHDLLEHSSEKLNRDILGRCELILSICANGH